MMRIRIDGQDYHVDDGLTVFEACRRQGIEIPHFCYHERLAIAGNCRMCLVELDSSPKPIASCAMPAAEGMDIRTDSPMVKKARHGVMEFLLINHPLDCPICDQGGECDLQDQAMAYGRFHSRFDENKRAVAEKPFGPLIKSSMTRCIHCTRCVRFATEVAGIEDLGALGRGENVEIGTYVEKALTSELSGNMIDLCPVGALTSKPYAFKARSWELRKTDSIDVMDAVGSHIRLDSRGTEVMRVLPRRCDAINEEWISDKTRFAYDGLKLQRLDRPWLRHSDGVLRPSDWQTIEDVCVEKIKQTDGTRIAALAGELCDCESMFMLKELLDGVSCPHRDCRPFGTFLPWQERWQYLFNTTIAGIEEADACLLIGAYPRYEAALVEARLRKRYLQGGFQGRAFRVGTKLPAHWQIEDVGESPHSLTELADSGHRVAQAFKQAKKPMIIVGMGALQRSDSEAIWHHIMALVQAFGVIRDDWNGFNVLHTRASMVGGMDVGFVPSQGGEARKGIEERARQGSIDVLWLLGEDDVDEETLKKPFVIYQGHHGERGASAADVIVPVPAYSEKDALYMNMEGRLQRGLPAVPPLGQAKEDWRVLTDMANRLGQTWAYQSQRDARRAMQKAYPLFAEKIGNIAAKKEKIELSYRQNGHSDVLNDTPLHSPLVNYYQSNVIARASQTMGRCVSELGGAVATKEKAK
ncbi:MAG: NADH-quinone oxidoreductase subunit G [Alphaproteobacteria bacterium GM202ARS2]|nr:NADH-quinone oxidoreductase subunit G [Alphaproteobacteria bacterium GM202ARS2]